MPFNCIYSFLILTYKMNIAVCISQWGKKPQKVFFLLSVLRLSILMERCDVIHLVYLFILQQTPSSFLEMQHKDRDKLPISLASSIWRKYMRLRLNIMFGLIFCSKFSHGEDSIFLHISVDSNDYFKASKARYYTCMFQQGCRIYSQDAW